MMKRGKRSVVCLQLQQEKYDEVKKKADERQITIQELIRCVMIPEWLRKHRAESLDFDLVSV